jgi:hypothetical protein
LNLSPREASETECGGFRILSTKERWINGVRNGASKGRVARGVHREAVPFEDELHPTRLFRLGLLPY